MGQYVRQTLQEGLFGWQVTDCVVTMTECDYSVADGPPSRRGPLEHGRRLPQAHADRPHAGARAGRDGRLRADRPGQPRAPDGHDRGGHAARWRGSALPSRRRRCTGSSRTIETVLPAARAQDLQRQLPGLTGGEGVLESELRRLPAGERRPADPAADDGEPAQPRGVPDAPRATRLRSLTARPGWSRAAHEQDAARLRRASRDEQVLAGVDDLPLRR